MKHHVLKTSFNILFVQSKCLPVIFSLGVTLDGAKPADFLLYHSLILVWCPRQRWPESFWETKVNHRYRNPHFPFLLLFLKRGCVKFLPLVVQHKCHNRGIQHYLLYTPSKTMLCLSLFSNLNNFHVITLRSIYVALSVCLVSCSFWFSNKL